MIDRAAVALRRWILRADPEAGLEMFIQMEEALPPAAALPILTAQAPSLCAPYLETALANGTASAKEYHNDLAGIYLRTLLGRARGGENGHAGTSSTAHMRQQPDQSAICPSPSCAALGQRNHAMVVYSGFSCSDVALLVRRRVGGDASTSWAQSDVVCRLPCLSYCKVNSLLSPIPLLHIML